MISVVYVLPSASDWAAIIISAQLAGRQRRTEVLPFVRGGVHSWCWQGCSQYSQGLTADAASLEVHEWWKGDKTRRWTFNGSWPCRRMQEGRLDEETPLGAKRSSEMSYPWGNPAARSTVRATSWAFANRDGYLDLLKPKSLKKRNPCERLPVNRAFCSRL